VRRALDRRLPCLARRARQIRDAARLRRLPTYEIDHGLVLQGDPGLGMSRRESGEMATFERLLAASDVLIDVGANVGLFTLVAARIGKPVLALEPEPRNVGLLLQNLLRNDLADAVDVLPIAAGAGPGALPLFGGGQGASLVQGWGGIRSTYRRLVPVSSLDRVLAGRFDGQQLLVKVDVEGAELEVLDGAAATMTRSPRPMWIVENTLVRNHPTPNPRFREVFERFWSLGYGCATVDGQLVTADDVDEWIRRLELPTADVNFYFSVDDAPVTGGDTTPS
jgi:FkbM family methyltransferase